MENIVLLVMGIVGTLVLVEAMNGFRIGDFKMAALTMTACVLLIMLIAENRDQLSDEIFLLNLSALGFWFAMAGAFFTAGNRRPFFAFGVRVPGVSERLHPQPDTWKPSEPVSPVAKSSMPLHDNHGDD